MVVGARLQRRSVAFSEQAVRGLGGVASGRRFGQRPAGIAVESLAPSSPARGRAHDVHAAARGQRVHDGREREQLARAHGDVNEHRVGHRHRRRRRRPSVCGRVPRHGGGGGRRRNGHGKRRGRLESLLPDRYGRGTRRKVTWPPNNGRHFFFLFFEATNRTVHAYLTVRGWVRTDFDKITRR